MRFGFVATTAALFVLCFATTVAAQEKKDYTAPTPPAARVEKAADAAAAAFTGAQFGWASSLGTWDGKGLFHEVLGPNLYVAKASQYSEDANFCYYQETTATSWLWALAKNPNPGTTSSYTLWYSTSSATTPVWQKFVTDAKKLARTGDAYP